MLEARDWRKIQALQDFQHALSAITFFMDIGEQETEIERRRFRCYHDSAVVAYCRPFTKSSGLPMLSLRDLGIKASVDQRALHDRLMSYRNQVVAHTDEDRMRLLLTSFTVLEKFAMPQIVKDEGFEFLDDMRKIETWLRMLIRALSEYVFEMMQKMPHGTRLLKDHLEQPS